MQLMHCQWPPVLAQNSRTDLSTSCTTAALVLERQAFRRIDELLALIQRQDTIYLRDRNQCLCVELVIPVAANTASWDGTGSDAPLTACLGKVLFQSDSTILFWICWEASARPWLKFWQHLR